MIHWGRFRIGLWLVLLATAARLCWALAVPTILVGDFATYRESAIYLAEFGHLDAGFVYMPGLIVLLAALHQLGAGVLAAKMLGVLFGGLAAGPLYMVAARLTDNGQPMQPGQPLSDHGARPHAGAPAAALIAGLAYALWPAGIAMASVIGTDIPTAAIILLALALLCTWGDTRPLLAATAFGAAMGVAAYFRAVALPLTVLSAAYWLARRVGWRATVARTALAVAVTAVVLCPWGLRNRRHGGEFYLTDSHGGITALMGNDPNTEGTYSRSLPVLFRELTGRTFLMEPHRLTDRVAYRLAEEFMAFDPVWTAGMIALRIERLFAPERGLLYWPVYRPGVVPPATAAWFNQHRPAVTALADWFYLLLAFSVCAGVAFAVVERRWTVLVPLPFALLLAVTYALFVAEPRYRVTTEVLLFPVAGFGAWRFCAGGWAVFTSWWGGVARRWSGSPRGPGVTGPSSVRGQSRDAGAPRGIIPTFIAVACVVVASLVVVRAGQALRAKHRWAATVWQVDGRPELALWRAAGSRDGPSPVRATPPGAALRLGDRQSRVDAEVVLPHLTRSGGSGTMFQLQASLAWTAAASVGTRVSLGGITADTGATTVRGAVQGAIDPTRIAVRLERGSGENGIVEVVISDVVLTALRGPADVAGTPLPDRVSKPARDSQDPSSP